MAKKSAKKPPLGKVSAGADPRVVKIVRAAHPNKTEMIREVLKLGDFSNSPTDLAVALRKAGVKKVSAAYVSTIKSNLKQRGEVGDGSSNLEKLVATKKFVDDHFGGSIDKAEATLKDLRKLK